jgi:hypothetical protein
MDNDERFRGKADMMGSRKAGTLNNRGSPGGSKKGKTCKSTGGN